MTCILLEVELAALPWAIVGGDAQGSFEGGAVTDGAVDADFVINCIGDEKLDFREWA